MDLRPIPVKIRNGKPPRPPQDDDPDPKRWERRMAFLAGWFIGLIILKYFGLLPDFTLY